MPPGAIAGCIGRVVRMPVIMNECQPGTATFRLQQPGDTRLIVFSVFQIRRAYLVREAQHLLRGILQQCTVYMHCLITFSTWADILQQFSRNEAGADLRAIINLLYLPGGHQGIPHLRRGAGNIEFIFQIVHYNRSSLDVYLCHASNLSPL
ncbi:hypothetical protein D3C75_1047540 [compost metagenome]